ncbi:hypothetical protein PPYR_01241 [Photinus pyralis]|uniref:Uncharacterized protein n=1 Tax=Photinus pyralis TaxID=7054 RepID=A0A5N4B3S5_PHOPY|nr:hypothetical protein PPYR_01241 [Photinus pyralis]
MGVALINNRTVNKESINDWISKVKCKKMSLKRQKRKNLFMEAILTHALYKAEIELKSKQQQRLQRWRSIKANVTHVDFRNQSSPVHVLDCEELYSLNQFMSQLKDIKFPVER